MDGGHPIGFNGFQKVSKALQRLPGRLSLGGFKCLHEVLIASKILDWLPRGSPGASCVSSRDFKGLQDVCRW